MANSLSPISASRRDWNDWHWQLKNRIRDLDGLERVFTLTEDERAAVMKLGKRLPLGITPYYAALVSGSAPLRKTKIPRTAEFERAPGEYDDPLGEEAHHVVPGLVHTYPDKVLFLVTDFCATYCRYCMRSRLVGKGTFVPDHAMWERALAYIGDHPEVRDVLVSGGDPLVMADDRLEWLLKRLRAIPHVEMIRIGTKVPAVLPQRITRDLCRMLKKYHPLYMSLHFVHPDELTPETARACERLADAGIPLGGQMVLLKGVNDDAAVMKKLCTGLLKIRVKPYYLHQCDAIAGSSHFRTPVQAGLDIIRALHGHTTGYAVPAYMIDAPGGGGKVPVTPDYILKREGEDLVIRNYAGTLYRYRDPEYAALAESRHA
ncbi:MAG TPA: KamA family radical SAM protein [Kiritimatiellia bacterium]|jgi:lysine 2,3-aminomutase